MILTTAAIAVEASRMKLFVQEAWQSLARSGQKSFSRTSTKKAERSNDPDDHDKMKPRKGK